MNNYHLINCDKPQGGTCTWSVASARTQDCGLWKAEWGVGPGSVMINRPS